jgi:hypothetical protein
MAEIRRRTIAPGDRALSAEAGARLDRLLAEPCLYREPAVMMPTMSPHTGSEYVVLEIVSPTGHRTVQTVSPGMGLTSQVLAIVGEAAGGEP